MMHNHESKALTSAAIRFRMFTVRKVIHKNVDPDEYTSKRGSESRREL
jgi:hypothetical protein